MEHQQNERLELRSENSTARKLESKLSEMTRKKPKITNMKSSVLSRVKAFIPEMEKGEVDLWQQIKLEVCVYYKLTRCMIILGR